MIKNNSKNIIIFLLLTSTIALVLAYVSQYIFGLEPCHLCLWQRMPFWAIIILSVLVLLIKKYQNLAIHISLLLLIINAGIAFYHAGVEKKVFKGLDSCSAPIIGANNIVELEQSIAQTKIVRCDTPQFVFLGVSMAGWNFIYCLGLTLIVVFYEFKPIFRKETKNLSAKR